MIKYNEIINNEFNISPHQLKIKEFENKNSKYLENLLSRKLKKSDNGIEVGSANYISESQYLFFKTKCANSSKFIIDLTSEDNYKKINYNAFVKQNLKKGDILISKDSNIGESCILNDDYQNCMVSGAFYKLPITEKKYYIFAFMQTNHFKNQLDLLVPKGATIRHAGTKFLNCKIPFPNYNYSQKIIEYIENITKLIIEKEIELERKEKKIFSIINSELENNRKSVNIYKLPKFNDIKNNNRMDAGYYSKELKDKMEKIQSYENGYESIIKLGYSIKRGQNLQISCIGESYYSDVYSDKYYKIVKPTNFSEYGTVSKYEYIGNKNELSLLQEGDIVFSAEGTIGKCVMFKNIHDKVMTNIHGIILRNNKSDIIDDVFICSFLRFMRSEQIFEYLSVGGQGGSLAMKYWENIIIPNFSIDLKKQISELYCGDIKEEDLFNLSNVNNNWIKKASIYELDKSINKSKNILNRIFEYIVENKEIDKKKLKNIVYESNYIY